MDIEAVIAALGGRYDPAGAAIAERAPRARRHHSRRAVSRGDRSGDCGASAATLTFNGSMNTRLKWQKCDPNPEHDGSGWVATGDHARFYNIALIGGESWMAWLSFGEPGGGAVARAWGRTLDEAKRMADQWERLLAKYEMPQVQEWWERNLNWTRIPEMGLWITGVGKDTYRIWRVSNDRNELWWWDGPYTGMGGMGADYRSAENAYKLGTYPSLGAAKAAAQRHADKQRAAR